MTEPAARAAAVLAVALAGALALSACGGARTEAGSADRSVLLIRCPAPEASLWIDGRYIAPVADLRAGVALHPGHHRVEVRDDDHQPYYGDVTLVAGQHRTLHIALAPRL